MEAANKAAEEDPSLSETKGGHIVEELSLETEMAETETRTKSRECDKNVVKTW